MKTGLFMCSIAAVMFFSACNSNTSTSETSDSAISEATDTTTAAPAMVDPDPTDTIPADGYDASSSNMEVAAMIKKSFTDDILKNDLAALTERDRKFKYQGFDLNDDGKDEYFVTITSPYFCGTGGCSAWLLDNDGKQISSFSVLDFPIYVAEGASEGFHDLIMNSKGILHSVKMKGGKYPGNPSVQPVYKGDPPSTAPQLLDIYKSPFPAFTF